VPERLATSVLSLFAGQLHFEAKEYSEAGEAWEQLVAVREARDDAYARLGLANLQLISVQADSNKVAAL
jgi:cytochrome c-type biogenesis protein CcmH/NrfG